MSFYFLVFLEDETFAQGVVTSPSPVMLVYVCNFGLVPKPSSGHNTLNFPWFCHRYSFEQEPPTSDFNERRGESLPLFSYRFHRKPGFRGGERAMSHCSSLFISTLIQK